MVADEARMMAGGDEVFFFPQLMIFNGWILPWDLSLN